MLVILKNDMYVNLFSVPEQWTSIPVLVKIYKLLVNELSNQIECNMSTRGARGDEDDDVSASCTN